MIIKILTSAIYAKVRYFEKPPEIMNKTVLYEILYISLKK